MFSLLFIILVIFIHGNEAIFHDPWHFLGDEHELACGYTIENSVVVQKFSFSVENKNKVTGDVIKECFIIFDGKVKITITAFDPPDAKCVTHLVMKEAQTYEDLAQQDGIKVCEVKPQSTEFTTGQPHGKLILFTDHIFTMKFSVEPA
ncbi:unnamed protein product, partial [Mesorhabditis belari]|uniref:Uncharacterized protein n=1 Tax=Mesorhabditis belari TaxID=2138241 RepID=A0AAF3J4K1_9BILA